MPTETMAFVKVCGKLNSLVTPPLWHSTPVSASNLAALDSLRQTAVNGTFRFKSTLAYPIAISLAPTINMFVI